MRKRASNSDRAELDSLEAHPARWQPNPQAGGEGGLESSSAGRSIVASHEALFAPAEAIPCDACGCDLEDDETAEDLGGRGVYVWTRGDDVRLEDAPLCASCASAIGMTALARWEIEEEEG